MALCKQCVFYIESIDELGRDFNDIGDEQDHFCLMYDDAIPECVFYGNENCPFYEPKGVKP